MARDDPSKYRPGHRNRPLARGTGQVSKNRAAWCRTSIGQFVLMLEPPSAEAPKVGTDIRLLLPRPGSRDVALHLTALTTEELEALWEFMTLLFETARPVCEERDKVAQDALDNGDDSHVRVYRQAPQLVVRAREVLADHEGLRRRPYDLPDVDGEVGSSDGGLRGAGDGVAERVPGDDGPEDDGPEKV